MKKSIYSQLLEVFSLALFLLIVAYFSINFFEKSQTSLSYSVSWLQNWISSTAIDCKSLNSYLVRLYEEGQSACLEVKNPTGENTQIYFYIVSGNKCDENKILTTIPVPQNRDLGIIMEGSGSFSLLGTYQALSKSTGKSLVNLWRVFWYTCIPAIYGTSGNSYYKPFLCSTRGGQYGIMLKPVQDPLLSSPSVTFEIDCDTTRLFIITSRTVTLYRTCAIPQTGVVCSSDLYTFIISYNGEQFSYKIPRTSILS